MDIPEPVFIDHGAWKYLIYYQPDAEKEEKKYLVNATLFRMTDPTNQTGHWVLDSAKQFDSIKEAEAFIEEHHQRQIKNV